MLGDQPNQFSIYGAARSFGQRQPPDFLAVGIRYDASSRLINLTLFEERQHDAVPLYLSSNMRHHIHMRPSTRLCKAANWRLWFGDDEEPQDLEQSQLCY
jgi:fatty acid synthase subunit alpha